MKQTINYLNCLTGDIFKLLPMKEAEMKGQDNHLHDYMETLIVNLKGAVDTYPELANEKQFLYIINSLQYLVNNTTEFKQWRRIVLTSTRYINNIIVTLGGTEYGCK